ncbi:hypothetical protein C9374_008906 [Naegleria lovaniensis]|uniref:Uncharacterized protein n=1 Tax=Naegleria lovaniensis TaxID=51637 RepID=A0AA88GIH3_NAELO|nr:uncharacterized protein C9374_008906 [Naegleria lovaniensis]KAG2377821.1 hypothetical protein C9374_008906 [Naegleria lovaniensis]
MLPSTRSSTAGGSEHPTHLPSSSTHHSTLITHHHINTDSNEMNHSNHVNTTSNAGATSNIIINNNNHATGGHNSHTTINAKKIHHNDHSSGITASSSGNHIKERVKKEEHTQPATTIVISEEEKIDGQPSIPQQVAHAVVTSIVNSNTVTSNRTLHNFKNSLILKVINVESELISLSDRVVFGKRSNEILEEEITYEYLKDYYYQNDNPIDSLEKGNKNFSPSFSFSFKEDQRARMLFFFSMLISFILCVIPGLMVVSFLPCCIFYWCSDMIKYKSRRARAYATMLFYSSVCLSLCCFLIFVIIIPCALLAEFGVTQKKTS